MWPGSMASGKAIRPNAQLSEAPEAHGHGPSKGQIQNKSQAILQDWKLWV